MQYTELDKVFGEDACTILGVGWSLSVAVSDEDETVELLLLDTARAKGVQIASFQWSTPTSVMRVAVSAVIAEMKRLSLAELSNIYHRRGFV